MSSAAIMHKTTFHANLGDVFLFKDWVLHGRKETYLTCLLLVVLGILYQAIKFARQQYGRRCHNIRCKRYILNKGHLLQTLMYIVQFAWGYFLMLAVMTYNVWILISVVVGFSLGYFFFGWGDYEDPSAALHIQESSGRSCRRHCGMPASSSGSATQELLPLSESGDEISVGTKGDTGVRCTCGESRT